jgi:hypothetical protein
MEYSLFGKDKKIELEIHCQTLPNSIACDYC